METDLKASRRCHRPSAREVEVGALAVDRMGLEPFQVLVDPNCSQVADSRLREQILVER